MIAENGLNVSSSDSYVSIEDSNDSSYDSEEVFLSDSSDVDMVEHNQQTA